MSSTTTDRRPARVELGEAADRLTALLAAASPQPWTPGIPCATIVAPSAEADETSGYYGGGFVAESMSEADRALILTLARVGQPMVDYLRSGIREYAADEVACGEDLTLIDAILVPLEAGRG